MDETILISEPQEVVTVSVQEGEGVFIGTFTRETETVDVFVEEKPEEVFLGLIDEPTLKLESLNSAGISDIVTLTQQEYEDLEEKDPTVLYLIVNC